ncbi:coiled-coil domain-containing protein 18-like [Pteropus medius]|uniref:coiled-coil domain-containing protein 18-like n=1 Tax=Pteropus vampyrus TaxID=132908 RepID=UPI00196B870A|nr:coiled-coil domain-containing protein 18-like [Pteropus giganteus]
MVPRPGPERGSEASERRRERGGFCRRIPFSSSNPIDQEIKSLREKLNKLRQQNACLVSQNHSLMTKIESVHFELTQSRAKVSMLESAQQQAANVPILEEQIINLEAEVSAQDKVLREAEDKLEQSQKMVIEKEQSLQKSQEECIKLKVDLLEQSKQGKRYVFFKASNSFYRGNEEYTTYLKF